jgi:hypothetical protein
MKFKGKKLMGKGNIAPLKKYSIHIKFIGKDIKVVEKGLNLV